jgi:Ni/Co efflux regulator RcnB
MKSLLLAAAISLTFLSTAAMAMPGGHGNGHGHSGHSRGDGDHDGRRAYRHGHRKIAHRHHDNGLHLGQYKFARGERVPDMYMQPRYYVEDYRVYHLAPPPSGYRWVRPDNGRYLLISTATGLISQILGY